MRIGICGGTFDPFHCGHLAPIVAARGSMQWDRVLYIPAFVQPFKQNRETASAYHRFAMTVLGTEEYEDFYVSPSELERGSISYTIDTLKQLRREYRDAALDWIIGDDNLEKLLDWKSIDMIFEMARFVVLTRGAAGSQPAESLPGELRARLSTGKIVFARNETVPVSSTEIRRRLRDGEAIDELVPPRVSRYIHHYGLYGKA